MEETDNATKPPRLVVNVADLRKRLGQRREESIELIMPKVAVIQSRTTDKPVTGALILESMERGVAVKGELTATWEADCRRCLTCFTSKMTIEVDEIFQIDAPADSELIDFDGQHVDLAPLVRDAVVLSLPLVPLCKQDCLGPDPSRYPAELEEKRVSAARDQIDPRWAALADVDFSEEE